MENIRLKHYPPGIPGDVNVDEFASLVEVLQRSCSRFAALPTYGNMGATLSYAEFDRASRDFAGYLQTSLRLKQDACRADDAQPAAVSGRAVRHLARGSGGRRSSRATAMHAVAA